ncbi:dihydroorotate oxidase [Candidatus Woesearchaeota archaeon]|nr:dihydroorotate oxidase [Candidatus Woesearchaeota archaeon]MBW3022189.1 dihydroorotate oxidase [Candidatus Woesearchaeota archaeon]
MKTSVAGIEFKHPIFNASGPRCTELEELEEIAESSSAAILMKSCTREPREGNPEPRYYDLPHGSINSMGLPNLGYKEYLRFIPILRAHGKPVVASVSGLSLADNIEMLKAFDDSDVDMIELNLSCPNVPDKPQMAYDFPQSDEVLRAARAATSKPLGVKLPPYFDPVHIDTMAGILNEHKVDFVTCINSLGNGLVIDPKTESVVIKPKEGFGGIGGKYCQFNALANVRRFYQKLDHADVIGVGGIDSGVDVFTYILAGASAVQIGTAFQQEGPGCFFRILNEFKAYMQNKGYSSIDEIKGKVKTL